MARLIKVDGTEQRIEPQDKANGFTLAEVYAHIGGGCDIVQPVPAGSTTLLCDEEGKLRGQPLNMKATREFGRFLIPGDWLAGNVIVLEHEQEFQ